MITLLLGIWCPARWTNTLRWASPGGERPACWAPTRWARRLALTVAGASAVVRSSRHRGGVHGGRSGLRDERRVVGRGLGCMRVSLLRCCSRFPSRSHAIVVRLVTVGVLIDIFGHRTSCMIRSATLSAEDAALRRSDAGAGPVHLYPRRPRAPNITPIVWANLFVNIAFALASLSACRCLGLGVGAQDTPSAEKGRQLADRRAMPARLV